MWRDLWFDDRTVNTIDTMLRAGIVRFDIASNRFEAVVQGRFHTNWLFVGHTENCRNCFLWHEIMFDRFGLVPEFCRFHCHKVVAYPRNCMELIQFYHLMAALPFLYGFVTPIPGKAGIDARDYTAPAYPDVPGKYSAFFYANSMKYGHVYYQYVRDAVDKYMPDGREMRIILKKSCTEFEAAHPDTSDKFWQHMTPDERELEWRLNDMFHVDVGASVQPDWLRNRTILRWIKHARMCGDLTGNQMLGNPELGLVRAVTYHDGVRRPWETKTPAPVAAPEEPSGNENGCNYSESLQKEDT